MAQDDVGCRLRTDEVEDDDTVDPYESHVVDEERDAQRGDVLDDEIIDPYEGDGSDEDDNDDDDTGDVESTEYDKKKTDMDDEEEDQETRDVGNIDYDERKTSLKWYISHLFHLVQGKMNHGMEDYIVVKNKKLHGFQLGLYAIFDGHSGCDVAQYLQSHLFDNILKEVLGPNCNLL